MNSTDVLWFDVGIKRYTTLVDKYLADGELWFDVGIKRYTTRSKVGKGTGGCGLM